MSSFILQLRTEFLIEYRSWSQSGAILLFVLVLAYVISRIKPGLSSTPELVITEFSFIFWLFLMLISVSIAIRTEGHSDDGEHILIYSLISPLTAFFAKYFFNVMYLALIGIGFYLALYFFYAPQVSLSLDFVTLILCGAISIAAALSFTSAIASHLVGQNTILSILSIPILIPVILTLYQMSVGQVMQGSIEMSQYLTLFSISLLSIALSLFLFPMVWKQ
jgi:heme exporter protein B